MRPTTPSSFPPALDLGRTLSGIGPRTPEPPSAREGEQRPVELLRRLAEHEERGRVLLAERDGLRKRVAALEAETSQLADERERLGRELGEARAEGARHEALAREQAELRVRLGEDYATTVAALSRRVSELEEQLATLRAEGARSAQLEREAEAAAALALRSAELEPALEAANRRVRELEPALETADRRVRELELMLEQAAAMQPPRESDLKRLKGIGPGLERALIAAGVTELAQIAAWTDADIAAIAPVVRARPERIRREDWVGRARRLLEGH